MVVPVFNSRHILPDLCQRVAASLSTIPHELILVDDGSVDESWEEIRRLASCHSNLHGILLTQNFGQQKALLCGIHAARNEVVVTMDDDLQHPPEEIGKLLRAVQSGYDLVYGKPYHRQQPVWVNASSYLFRWFLRMVSGIERAHDITSFRAFRRDLCPTLEEIGGSHIWIDPPLNQAAATVGVVGVKHGARAHGRSTYTLRKRMALMFYLLSASSVSRQEPAYLVREESGEGCQMTVEYLRPVPWETRNLGMPAFEIDGTRARDITENSLAETLGHLRREHARFFIQVRLDRTERRVIPLLERYGFQFVETTMTGFARLQGVTWDEFNAKLEHHVPNRFVPGDLSLVALERQNAEDRQAVRDLAQGAFSCDRFHLDPSCPPGVADRRFAFWINDLLLDPNVSMWVLRYQAKIAGFGATRGSDFVLMAIAKEFQACGLGVYCFGGILNQFSRQGHKWVRMVLSANNLSMLNLATRHGLSDFRQARPTFHYWGDQRNA